MESLGARHPSRNTPNSQALGQYSGMMGDEDDHEYIFMPREDLSEVGGEGENC